MWDISNLYKVAVFKKTDGRDPYTLDRNFQEENTCVFKDINQKQIDHIEEVEDDAYGFWVL